MNRREFFKVLAASAVVAAVPSISFAKPVVVFNGWRPEWEDKEFGTMVTMPGPYKDYAQWTSDFLVKNAREYLGKGVVVEIRVGIPSDYGRTHGAAWYVNKEVAKHDVTGHIPLTINRYGGYWSAGFFRT